MKRHIFRLQGGLTSITHNGSAYRTCRHAAFPAPNDARGKTKPTCGSSFLAADCGAMPRCRKPLCIAPQHLLPHWRNALLFAPDLHPVVAQNKVLPVRRLHDCQPDMEGLATGGREMHTLDVMVSTHDVRRCATTMLSTHSGRYKFSAGLFCRPVGAATRSGSPANSCAISFVVIHCPLMLWSRHTVNSSWTPTRNGSTHPFPMTHARTYRSPTMRLLSPTAPSPATFFSHSLLTP